VTAADMLAAVDATLAASRRCFFVTPGLDGGASARLVEPFDKEPGYTFWVLTSASSRKVAELRRGDLRMSLAFQDDGETAFVTLVGTAELIVGRGRLDARWKPSFEQYFENGLDDPDAMYIRFTSERIELWNGARGITPERVGTRSAILVREEDRWTVLCPGSAIADAARPQSDNS